MGLIAEISGNSALHPRQFEPLGEQIRKPNGLGHVGFAVAQHQFHPAHVVPAPELLRTAIERAYQAISHMSMKILAIVREIFVVRIVRHCDECAHIGHTHGSDANLKCLMQPAANTVVPYLGSQID